MAAADPLSDMLTELSACAYRLGMAFGGEAERAEAAAVKLEYFRLFDRCFFAVRVATALELRLRRAPVAGGAAAGKAAGPGDERLERAEAERAESEDAEPETAPAEGRYAEEGDRDREREAEPASLPVLLRTLGEVAADAAALPGPPPADLPTLRELLTHVGSGGGPASARSPERSSAAGLRARLAGSATAVALAPRPPVQPGGTAGKLATRRATGPPGR